MVIGERFAWAHLPKTGGDATQAMLSAVPGLVHFADPASSHDKHMPFWARGDEMAGKLLVMNIRRLPEWAVSLARHKARVGTHPDHSPEPMPAPEALAESTEGDDTLRWMTDGGRFAVDRWLRTERLEEDVLRLLEDLGGIDGRVEEAVRAVGVLNAAPGGPSETIELSDEQVARLYERNPAWAEIERSTFGDLSGLWPR
jgi:hypothetical protein